MELAKKAENEENRPPSPRPCNALQVCVEHNKQMQVWENWVALTNIGVENDVANINYKRTESLNAPDSLPKALKPQSAEELYNNGDQ